MRTLVVWLALCSSVPAQAGALAEAVQAAWQRSPEARLIEGRVDELRARRDAADALTAGPAALGLAYLGDRIDRDAGRAEWELEAAVPLWQPGERGAARAEAEAGETLRKAQTLVTRARLTAEVRNAHLAWRAQRAGLAEAEARLALASELAADLRRRERTGEAARFDANLAEGERLHAARLAQQARTALSRAQQDWRSLTGLPPPETLDPPTARASEPPLPALAREEAALAAAETRRQATAPRDAPELALRLKSERDTRDSAYSQSAGIALRWRFGGDSARAGLAAAAARQAAAAAEQLRTQTRSDDEQALLSTEVERTAEAIASAQQQRDLARDNHALAERAWRLGEYDLATLLRARIAALDAEALLRTARFDHEATQIRLDHFLGATP